MKRYDTYKDSGVQWLGEIPGHWKILRIKNICECYGRIGFRGYTTNDFVAEGCGAITISPSNMKDMKMDFSKCSYLSWDKYNESPEIQIKDGDVLFVKTGSTFGKTSYVESIPTASTINPQIVCFKNHNQLPKFLVYILNTKVGRMQIDFSVVGGTIPTIAQSKINNYSFAFPPLSEQHAIVSYLDDKCGKIDEWIEKKQKEVELLGEMKQRVIADAVTRGLPSTGSGQAHVKMKQTNIPWLPEVPEHWEVYCLRRFLKLFTEKGHGDKQLLSVTRDQGVIVRNAESKEENHNFIPEDLSGYKYVQEGDFVINKMKSWQGSYGVSEYEGIVSPAYFTCKLSGVDKEFFSTSIRSKIYISFFAQFSKGIRVDQWDLSPIALKSIPFLLPPLSEQHAIVSYITERTAKIDKLVENVNREIENLKEYKQRLISDVVTGQIKVC